MIDLHQLAPFLKKAEELRRKYENNRVLLDDYLQELKLSNISDCCVFQELAINFIRSLRKLDKYKIATALRMISFCNPIELHDHPGENAVSINKNGVVQVNVLCKPIEIAEGLGIKKAP